LSAIAVPQTAQYEALTDWAKVPAGVKVVEVPGIAVDSQNNVYVLTRGDLPVLVFDEGGNFLRSFGEGVFTARAHGISISPDDTIYFADDGTHTITKWSTDGKLLMTLGTRNEPAKKWSGIPFNRPTHAVVSPKTGHLYISDGYGNSHIHKFTPDGQLLKTWGGPGVDPGQFIRPHDIIIDEDERLYVADRENQRVQVFDTDGNHLVTFHDIHRPAGLALGPNGTILVGELCGIDDAPGLGHRVSIVDRATGQTLSRFGDPDDGDTPGKFIAPHCITMDHKGDVYVGEVSFTMKGKRMDPPRTFNAIRKLQKTG
jgi:DNA-binding beta-propeller fold protein YncE